MWRCQSSNEAQAASHTATIPDASGIVPAPADLAEVIRCFCETRISVDVDVAVRLVVESIVHRPTVNITFSRCAVAVAPWAHYSVFKANSHTFNLNVINPSRLR